MITLSLEQDSKILLFYGKFYFVIKNKISSIEINPTNYIFMFKIK